MDVNFLLRLVIAHLLSDFFFQPLSWVKNRSEKKIKSVALLWHVMLTTIFAYALSGAYSCWWIPLAIFISHYIIDIVKSYLPGNLIIFFLDQLMHLLVIVIIWLIFTRQWDAVHTQLTNIFNRKQFWLLALAYIFVTWPLGITIGLATAKWRTDLEPKISNPKQADTGLGNAGKWIGICERMLILTFVLINQYTAIGFLMTAKSILRFSDKDNQAQKKAEYILVGTLLSFAAAALTGVVISYAIK